MILTSRADGEFAPTLAPGLSAASAVTAGAVTMVTVVAVLAGYLLRTPCALNGPRMYCYSDVVGLYSQRQLYQHVLPYVHGGSQLIVSHGQPVNVILTGHEFEYPVLTGLFAWLIALPTHSVLTYLTLTSIALGLFAVVTAGLLYRMAGQRALLFAAAPTLAFYAQLNWDLLPVAATVAGLYAWRRDRTGWAAALLSLGVCLKVWPGLVLAVVVADLLAKRRWRDAGRASAIAGAIALAVNFPFAVINRRGWEAPFLFQADRLIDAHADCLWVYVLPWAASGGALNRVAGIVCGIAWVLVLAYGWHQARRHGHFPVVPCAAAMVTLFVALGKVHSPQYALWILPFFALLRLRAIWWVGFVVTDAWLFAQWTLIGDFGPRLESAVIISDVFLLALSLAFLRAGDATSRAVEDDRTEVLSASEPGLAPALPA